jgi:ketosteroid isomerase-like protein
VSVEEENNKALVRRFLEAHAKGDLDALGEMLAPDYVNHSMLPGHNPDRDSYLQAMAEYHAAYSNIRYVIQKQLAEGEEVVTSFSARLTHDGDETAGFAPTGKEYEVTHIFIHRIAGDKIAEEMGAGTGLQERMEERLEQEMRERERVEHELRVARRIQQASLPKEVPKLEGWLISPLYQPASA